MSTNFVYTNFFNSSLAAPIVSTSATTMTLSSTTNAPAITGGQIWAVVLNDAATQSVFEIVYVTARMGAVCTITRGQEGTAAATWLASDYAYAPDTAGILANFALANVAGAIAVDTSATAQTKIGAFYSGSVIAAAGSGAYSSPGAMGGDLVAQRSNNASGVIFLGGASGSSALDYGVSSSGRWTFGSGNVALLSGSLLGSTTAYAGIAGDFSASRSTSAGVVFLGGTTMSGFLDYGVTNSGAFTLSQTAGGTTNLFLAGSGRFTAGTIAAAGTGTYTAPAGVASGDVIAQRSNLTGAIYLGGTTAAKIDFGVTTASTVTLSTPMTITGQLASVGATGAVAASAMSAVNFNTNAAAGDVTAQRSASTGLVMLGGGTKACGIDYNISNANGTSFFNEGVAYCQVYGLGFTNSSDATLKTNVAPIADAIETVMALKPVSFDWKHDGSSSLGFLAQDVQSVLPEIVSTDSNGTMGVNYNGIIPVCVAVQQEIIAKLHAAGIVGF